MKLLLEYTLDYIKRNRRSSLAIMIAILMTSAMMSCFCGFFYNIYSDNINSYLREAGNWHGELFDETSGSQLGTIKSFETVESIMIKGQWMAAKIDDPRRDYLSWRNANAEYWNSMPEGGVAIIEGRVPSSTGEIALSKQYFEHHPDLKIGDTITLPMGNRISQDGSPIEPQGAAQQGERFEETGVVSLTVVGKLDVATPSTVPAYTGLGYLEDNDIKPTDGITVYLRFHNIHDTYEELPKIAEAVGYEKDEYGKYLLRYNGNYLYRRGVLSPDQKGFISTLLANQMPLACVIMGLLIVGLFVLIIHNAFVMSSTARLSQLGIFASVGATPKQIKRSVIMEGMLLTIIPLPLGLIIGQGAVWLYVWFAGQQAVPQYMEPIEFVIGWQSVAPAIVLTLLTVWWSSLIPAKRVAKLSPIIAIRQGGAEQLKKLKSPKAGIKIKSHSITLELASNALKARRKSYRTATAALTLSFLALSCLLCINSASETSKAVYKSKEKLWEDKDIILTLYNVANPEEYKIATEQVEKMKDVKSTHWYSALRTAVWLPEEEFSDEFHEKGGFTAVEKHMVKAQVPLLRDGARRVSTTLLGLDDRDFDAYCATLGIDPTPFYEDKHWRGILYHTVNDVVTGTKRNPVPIPLFDIKVGDSMRLTEKTIDSYEGDFTFDMEILAVADEMPPIGGATFGSRYSAIQILPMSRIRELATQFKKSNIVRVDGVIEVFDNSQILSTRSEIDEVCDSYFGSGDYTLFDELEYYKNDEAAQISVALMFGFIVVPLVVIGLSSTWATVRGTLNARRREFAMLRSVGLPPKEIVKMLLIEASLLGFMPILLSLPITIAIQSIFLYVNEVTFSEWLPFAPIVPVLIYIITVLGVTALAYGTGGKKLITENILESMKVDSI